LNTNEGPRENTERWGRIEELFDRMLALPASERASALAAACPDDPSLVAEVLSLLDQPASAAGFLKKPALDVAARAVSPAGASMMGRRIGSFEVRSLIGIGGMGEVYRAHDSKLGRDVAIKVLPSSVARDADRLSWFRREARLLASLNHPNIASIHGLEESDGTFALVMEMVEGEDLAERLKRGPIPVDEAIAIARQVAEGLEAAHEKGIVHRDLKPANIKLTKDGAVKILDFGLAKAYDSESPAADAGALSDSPTISRRMTEAGAIVGTAAYMSPEQARGVPVDKRTDIWSFGLVLLEMLTGKAAFARDSTSDTLAAVLRDAPPFERLPRETPPSIRRIVERCLERDPRQRLRDIGDARWELESIGDRSRSAPVAADESRVEGGATTAAAGLSWKSAAILAATIALSLAAFGIWALAGLRAKTLDAGGSIAFEVRPPEGTSVRGTPAISNDGRLIAFSAARGGVDQIYVRRLDEVATRLLPGSTGGRHAFFSPDGTRVAFFANRQLKVVPVEGGSPYVVCESGDARGGSWGDDDFIVFAAGPYAALSRVPASGGAPTPFTRLQPGEISHRFPQVLPGARGTVFATQSTTGEAAVAMQAAAAPDHKVLLRRATSVRVSQGHMLFVNDRSELALAPFDIAKLELAGAPAIQPEQVGLGFNLGENAFGVAPNGTFAYVPFEVPLRYLSIEGRDGQRRTVPGPPRSFQAPRLSPDGLQFAVGIQTSPDWGDVWIGDIGGNFRPLTRDGMSRWPVWSPKGDRVIVESRRAGQPALFAYPADGRTEPTQLTDGRQSFSGSSWLPDDTILVGAYNIRSGTTGEGLQVLKPGGAAAARVPLAVTKPAFGRASPDGRWLAYTTAESGQWEVYVTDFPDARRVWPVSRAGFGREPVWAPSSHELFFLRADGQVMSVRVGPDGPAAVAPRSAGVGAFPLGGGPGLPAYEALSDGRFLVARPVDDRPAGPGITVVTDWLSARVRKRP